MRDLGTLPGDVHSLAYAVNEQGQCVGFSARRGADQRPFLFTDLTGMVDILDQLDPDEARRFLVGVPRAINAVGQIAGQGTNADGTAAYRLDPVGAAPYGHACAGTGGRSPALAGEGSTARGERFAFRVAAGLPGTVAALLIGTGNAATALGGGCDLLVSGSQLSPITLFLDGDGRASLPLTIPMGLLQTTVYAQVLVLDPASGNGRLTATNGLALALR